ncbi:glycoside hydrolase family 127 protein [Paraburkholderia sp. B3]|uniref:glycoside hydrolase family 127 protein n=1 Tax=Paraburkholderia sp. B3 TaxID=3134791 RepID=UPI003982614D
MNESLVHRPVVVDLSASPYARVKPVSISAVNLRGPFWGHRHDLNSKHTLISQWDLLESTGRLNNFRRVSGEFQGAYSGLFFNDSDLYKWLEAASWSLAKGPDAEIERRIDEGIGLIERAQEADGYIDTYFTVDRPTEKWTNLRDLHEMYVGGHLIQAAVAHHRATGSPRLLNVALRFADMLRERFGPASAGKVEGIDGHEEIEMALIELARETGQPCYLELARYFIEARGHGLLKGGRFGDAYFQDDVPFERMESLAGHAVRALYMVCGITDLYLETGDASLLPRLETLWDRLTAHRMYITGGVGSRHDGESIGNDYELPNSQAYTETCAAIGNMMWCHRMFAATGNARYVDLFEWTLYNGMLPGWSLDGQSYYYVNPLENDGAHRRKTWYECACCPPNVARTIASLPGYVYGTDAQSLYVNLYVDSDATIDVAGSTVRISQRTRYPWEGSVDIDLDAESTFTLKLRIPGWIGADADPSSTKSNDASFDIAINGARIEAATTPDGYVEIHRAWHRGDTVRLDLSMSVRVWQSHPKVPDNRGRVALSRGPVLYCAEQADMPGVDLDEIFIDPSNLEASWDPGVLNGIVVLKGSAQHRVIDSSWSGQLYRPFSALSDDARTAQSQPVALTAIPYFAWHNRESGPMKVWLNYRDA